MLRLTSFFLLLGSDCPAWVLCVCARICAGAHGVGWQGRLGLHQTVTPLRMVPGFLSTSAGSELPVCASCGQRIYDGQYLQALNADWHADCFR